MKHTQKHNRRADEATEGRNAEWVRVLSNNALASTPNVTTGDYSGGDTRQTTVVNAADTRIHGNPADRGKTDAVSATDDALAAKPVATFTDKTVDRGMPGTKVMVKDITDYRRDIARDVLTAPSNAPDSPGT